MKILLTNDDGIFSPGIALLAGALRKEQHKVIVFAPDSDRSGVSHAITFLNGPCKVSKIDDDNWVCSGTPVDCIVLALTRGFPDSDKFVPDLVMSGVNRGANLGTDIIYSGTTAAARQAALSGFPSIALSLQEREAKWYWEPAIKFTVENLNLLYNSWEKNTFININFPNMQEAPKELIPAFPSKRHYYDKIDIYNAESGDTYYFSRGGKAGADPEYGSDHDVVSGNNVSISPIYIHPVSSDEIVPKRKDCNG